MSKVSEFYDALSKDQAMQERAKKLNDANLKTEEEMIAATIEFAKKEGFLFVVEEAKAYMTEKSKGELSGEDLDSAADGKAPCVCVIGGGSGTMACPVFGQCPGCLCLIGGGG